MKPGINVSGFFRNFGISSVWSTFRGATRLSAVPLVRKPTVNCRNSLNDKHKLMIKHIVLFKLADEAEGNSKGVNAAIIKQRLEALKDSIPEIVRIEVLINHADASDGNYDIMLDSEFNDLNALKAYVAHPEHVQAAEFITQVRTARAAIDYEL